MPKKTSGRNNSGSNYLSPLSPECQKFILDNKPNLYHSLMAILGCHTFADCDEFIKFYMNKYESERPYLTKNKKLVEEVAMLCWERYDKKGAPPPNS